MGASKFLKSHQKISPAAEPESNDSYWHFYLTKSDTTQPEKNSMFVFEQ